MNIISGSMNILMESVFIVEIVYINEIENKKLLLLIIHITYSMYQLVLF